MVEAICLAVGLLIGFGAGWFACWGRKSMRRAVPEERHLAVESRLNSLQVEHGRVIERNGILEASHQMLQSELEQERQFNISLHAEISRERTSRNHLEHKLEQQKTEMLELQKRLTQEFMGLANQVLEEKTRSYDDLNKSSLGAMLEPIARKLEEFKEKVEAQHDRETRELMVLHTKVANLTEAGQRPPSNGHSNGYGNGNGTHAEAYDDLNGAAIEPEPDAPIEALVPTGRQVSEYELIPSEAPVADIKPAAAPEPEKNAQVEFSRQQKVEFDNFIKRTIGRVKK